MKVLHVCPSIAASYGGPTQSLLGYVAASRSVGIDASVAAPIAAADDAAVFEAELSGQRLHLFPSFGQSAGVMSPALWRWLAREREQFDVVHVHGLFNPVSSLSARIAIAGNRATVIRPFGTMSRYTATHRRSRLKALYTAAIDRRSLDHAAALHFTTSAEGQEADWYGVDMLGRAFIVPPPYIGSIGPTSSPDGRLVVFLGRIDPVKNLESLLAAWPTIVQRTPDARLVIAGDGDRSYVRTIRARAEAVGHDAITFAGFVSGVAKEALLQRASIVVLPSHHENFGMVALEAAAHGVPLVMSTGVQLRDELCSLGVARSCAPDAASLADSVSTALVDDALRSRAAMNGPELVRTRFSRAAIGAQLATMYQFVVAPLLRKSKKPKTA